ETLGSDSPLCPDLSQLGVQPGPSLETTVDLRIEYPPRHVDFCVGCDQIRVWRRRPAFACLLSKCHELADHVHVILGHGLLRQTHRFEGVVARLVDLEADDLPSRSLHTPAPYVSTSSSPATTQTSPRQHVVTERLSEIRITGGQVPNQLHVLPRHGLRL